MRLVTLCVLSAVLLAGCTAPQDASSGEGLNPGDILGGGGSDAVTDDGLALSFQQVERFAVETEPVTLQLELENVGQGTARDIRAQLFGAFSSGAADIGTLQGIDRAAGQPGGSTLHEWEQEAPDVAEGETETMEAGVKVAYGYGTTATIPVTLVSESFVQGRSTVSAANTAGPVAISSDTSSPIPTGGETQEHTIPLTVTNVGDGTLESAVTLTPRLANPPEGVRLDCGGDTVSLSVTDESTTTCTLHTPEGGVSFETDIQVRVDARYRYSEEATTQVRVRGTS